MRRFSKWYRNTNWAYSIWCYDIGSDLTKTNDILAKVSRQKVWVKFGKQQLDVRKKLFFPFTHLKKAEEVSGEEAKLSNERNMFNKKMGIVLVNIRDKVRICYLIPYIKGCILYWFIGRHFWSRNSMKNNVFFNSLRLFNLL